MKVTREDLEKLKQELENKKHPANFNTDSYDRGYINGLEESINLIDELLNKIEK